jgi:hypothetical protein
MTSPRRFSFPQSQVWSGKLGFGMRPKIANLIDKSTGDKRPRAFIVSFGKSCARWHQDAQLPQDDETRRLIAAREACRAKELAAADQLSKPRHSMLYSAYTRLLDALGAVRLRCDEITLATEERRPGVLEERWKHARVFPYFRATANQKPLTVFLRQRGQSKAGLTQNLPIYTNVKVVELYAEAFGGTPQPEGDVVCHYAVNLKIDRGHRFNENRSV